MVRPGLNSNHPTRGKGGMISQIPREGGQQGAKYMTTKDQKSSSEDFIVPTHPRSVGKKN
jgi:hypothetical protein